MQPERAVELSPITSWINDMIPSLLWQHIIACVLIFVQAAYINRIVVKHRIASVITLWPGLIYILLVSLLPSYSYLSPVLIANTFILMVLSDIFKIYKKPFVVEYIFNAGVFISLASMIYSPYIIFAGAAFIGLAIIRSFKSKEIIQFFSGLFVPYFLYGTWKYYRGSTMADSLSLINFNLGWPDQLLPTQNYHYVLLAALAMILVIVIFSYGSNMMKKSIQTQKKIDILYWFMAFGMISLLFTDRMAYDHIIVLAIPLAVMLDMNLLRVSNTMLAELLHLGVLIFIGLLHFQVLPQF